MAIKFAEASISEKGTANGTKGDQANEVRISTPYTHSKGWRAFIHPDDAINKAVGIFAREIANNKHFGYGQLDRTTGYNACKSAGWAPSKVTTDCNIDCSELVRTCIACAKQKDVQDFNTSIEPSVLLSLGYKEITFNINKLEHGEIVCTKVKGHTAVCTDPTVGSVTSIVYYPKFIGNSSSIVVALQTVGEKDTSMEHRKKIAKANGITGYTGAINQNLNLVKLIKAGKLKMA